jgi:hypothetical protein
VKRHDIQVGRAPIVVTLLRAALQTPRHPLCEGAPTPKAEVARSNRAGRASLSHKFMRLSKALNLCACEQIAHGSITEAAEDGSCPAIKDWSQCPQPGALPAAHEARSRDDEPQAGSETVRPGQAASPTYYALNSISMVVSVLPRTVAGRIRRSGPKPSYRSVGAPLKSSRLPKNSWLRIRSASNVCCVALERLPLWAAAFVSVISRSLHS